MRAARARVRLRAMEITPEMKAALVRDDAAIIGKAFPLHGDNARVIQANARHLALLLRDTNIPDRASRAAAFAENLLDANIYAHVVGRVDCARGCDHCCKTYVSASIPEILWLARAVRGKAAKTARVNEAAAKSCSVEQYVREDLRLPCPMLENRGCSEYQSRPMVCRAVLSKSLDTCLRIFELKSGEAFTPADPSATVRALNVIILRAGLILAGLPYQHVEMNHALSIALADETAETRWLAGEPVFGAVAMDAGDAKPSPFSKIVDGLVGALRQTV